jgi:hypothetical protein
VNEVAMTSLLLRSGFKDANYHRQNRRSIRFDSGDSP